MDSENGATDGRVNPDPSTLQQRCGGERHQAQSRMGFTPGGGPVLRAASGLVGKRVLLPRPRHRLRRHR